MRLKSFHAPTIAEAMRQVRAVLGDDAIIVATRDDAGGVRVTAAMEEADQAIGRSPQIVGLQAAPDIADTVADALGRHGTPAVIVEKLVDSLNGFAKDSAEMALGAAFDGMFGFQPLPEAAPVPLMLVGPPGAGKTLSVAKLAARSALKGRPVGVITTDTMRAGGVDQLAAFTRVLKLKLISVEDAPALGDALGVHDGAELVLVDSAGRNPFDAADMDDLADLVASSRVEPVLVLPAGGDVAESAEIGAAFRAVGCRRMLATRIDITRRLGGLLAAAHDNNFAFCDISMTPKVAAGLAPLNPLTLARLILSGVDQAALTAKQTGTHS